MPDEPTPAMVSFLRVCAICEVGEIVGMKLRAKSAGLRKKPLKAETHSEAPAHHDEHEGEHRWRQHQDAFVDEHCGGQLARHPRQPRALDHSLELRRGVVRLPRHLQTISPLDVVGANKANDVVTRRRVSHRQRGPRRHRTRKILRLSWVQ